MGKGHFLVLSWPNSIFYYLVIRPKNRCLGSSFRYCSASEFRPSSALADCHPGLCPAFSWPGHLVAVPPPTIKKEDPRLSLRICPDPPHLFRGTGNGSPTPHFIQLPHAL